MREVVIVRNILDDYAKASRKYINLLKSEVTFSRNVDQGLKNDVISIMWINDLSTKVFKAKCLGFLY